MRVVIMVLVFVMLPIAYLYTLFNRVVTKKTQGARLSFLVFVAAVLTAAWALGQSRTEWAPVALLGVQGEAALAGLLALEFTEWRHAPSRTNRLLAWGGMAVALLIIVLNIAFGIRNAVK